MSNNGQARFMPPEWALHTATFMGFPHDAYPGSGVSRDDVQRAWAAVANTIVDHEPVNMLVNSADTAIAKRLLSSAVTRHSCAIDDAWLRDSGPTFVRDNGKLLGIDWVFNGWGDHTAFDWQTDAAIAQTVCEIAGVSSESSPLVNEGGGIHVDGRGRVLVTDTVQLDPNRNPDWTRERVATEIHRALGTEQAIWLPKGLYRDYLDHGTRGHVDIVACFIPDGRVVLHQQKDPAHPDFALFNTVRTILEDQGLSVIAVPAPTTVKDNRDWVDYSYINHYVCNDAVIVPTFADRQDDIAQEQLAELYPNRAICGVEGRVLFAMGGGVHCITQQQPAV